MTWTPTASIDRREAMSRAARAVVRLAADPSARTSARRQNDIVQDTGRFDDRDAWDAVAALEDMVVKRGLVTAAQIAAEQSAHRVAVLMGEDVLR